jgi:sulfatase modifying factor 1
MHKKVISFNDIFALKDMKAEDRLTALKKLKGYKQMLEGMSDENKKTAQYKDLMQKITEITKELGVGQVTPGFVRINPGTFIMGSTEKNDHNPEHKEKITRPFEMAQYQVTQEEFLKFKKDHKFGFPGHAKNPAEQVTWDEAVEYCKWLSLQADDIEQSYKNAVKELSPEEYTEYALDHPEARLYRLPTDAEWEYACRNEGRSTPDEMAKDLKQYAVYDKKSTAPVGSKKPNALGLYDMLGNVWEWCADCHADLAEKDAKDPGGLKSGQERVLRGGSWIHVELYARASYRYYSEPASCNRSIGFRLSRTVE